MKTFYNNNNNNNNNNNVDDDYDDDDDDNNNNNNNRHRFLRDMENVYLYINLACCSSSKYIILCLQNYFQLKHKVM